MSDALKITVAVETELLASVMQNADHVDRSILAFTEESHFQIEVP